MTSRIDTLLANALTEKGLMKSSLVDSYLEEAAKQKEGLYSLILKKGIVSEEELLKIVSEVFRFPMADLASLKVEPAVLKKVPLKIAEYYKIVPIKLDRRKLTIAVSEPPELRTQDDIRAHLGYEIDIALAREKDIQEALKRLYGFAAGTIGEMVAAASGGETPPATEPLMEKIENVEQLAGDASIAKLVNQIILEAFKKRATDIHIEPYRGKVKLRYRVDGILYNANVQGEIVKLIQPILSRIKIMSNLNIVERRLPQDGRAIVKIEDTTLDLRVSSIPTPYGESVVIRMLPINRIIDLAQLGLNAAQLQAFQKLIQKPHGIVFITGPTGSGKSTTLYACLNRINTDERKIITIEDPVEYEMEGVTQIQVVSAISLNFARGLRSILRHDPDVIMVGEVRDLETAEIAIRVALTGHLVFSTLHTNDAASGITRLIDIGIEPYLVASSVEAFVAQRLVRTLCAHCKEEDTSPSHREMKKEIAKELRKKESEIKIYKPKGCERCNSTGFWGRVAIYEMLILSEKIQELIMKRAPAADVKREAVLEGMRTLRQDGWLKVIQGVTTPEEILKVAEADKETAGAVEVLEEEAPGAVSRESLRRREASFYDPNVIRFGERRAFVRLDKTVNIRYKILKPKDEEEKPANFEEVTVAKNISAGGLVFTVPERIPLSSILELKIELPASDSPVVCLARVVREEEIEFKKSYELAVCFLDLSPADRARLEKFVERT